MGIALWCVWAAFTTAEVPEPVTSAEGLPEVAVPVSDSPEVVADAAERLSLQLWLQ